MQGKLGMVFLFFTQCTASKKRYMLIVIYKQFNNWLNLIIPYKHRQISGRISFKTPGDALYTRRLLYQWRHVPVHANSPA